VLSSPYGQIPGTTIPISVPGLLWFLVAGGLAFVVWNSRSEIRQLLIAEALWSGLGILTAFYLVYIELVVLHTLCAWCTALHLLILTLLITSIFQLQGASSKDVEEEEVEEMLPL
jgi:uncharacterized membrane protein